MTLLIGAKHILGLNWVLPSHESIDREGKKPKEDLHNSASIIDYS